MRVSLFGLFLRGTNLMEPWPKPVQSNLPVSDFTSDFRFYDYYIMPACILLYHSCSIPPVSCSYLIIPWVLPVWYLFAPACFCSRHGFQWMIMIRLYRYTCTYLSTPSGFCITTRLGSFIWLPWILMSRSWSLERVDSPSCWSEWRSGSVDLQQTVQSSILPGPLCASRVFL